jgi:hypothetical protein
MSLDYLAGMQHATRWTRMTQSQSFREHRFDVEKTPMIR